MFFISFDRENYHNQVRENCQLKYMLKLLNFSIINSTINFSKTVANRMICLS